MNALKQAQILSNELHLELKKKYPQTKQLVLYKTQALKTERLRPSSI